MTNLLESEGSQSLEASASYTTTYSYDSDFVQGGPESGASWLYLGLHFLRSVALLTKTSLLGFIGLVWEALQFSAVCLIYLQKKTAAAVYFLEDLKDLVVRIFMWRRGFLFRPTTHGGLLVIVSVAFVVGNLFRSGVAPTDFTRDRVLAAQNTPETIIPAGRPRSETVKYTVKDGETLATIASAYSVSEDTIKWANDLQSDFISSGENLSIPPVTGVVHKVVNGDSLAVLAQKYEADPQTVADYPFNYIDDSLTLNVGQALFIPGGKIPAPKPTYWPSRNTPIFVAGGSGLFAWPVSGIMISQYPSWWHPGIDIAAHYGTPIYAANGGTVTTADYSRAGFGNRVIIDDSDGYNSLYCHLSDIKVAAGQTVSKGQLLGAVGCTGRCTGPHLHFEVHQGGVAINPLSLLP
jgi:murein DD-endopeptidase MepM/ murein hydrolase activator NlpD